MNNLTREVDERKKKLEDRENEVATLEKNMENKDEELQVNVSATASLLHFTKNNPGARTDKATAG
ncbi:hypothetical protein PF010_g22988 [Phytophthora fragariae]|nr:hypothetical protein PF010_g22988 [Phytophthora fragariae]KAE9188412.1 hypothetical protein PF004_g22508 [Phytophthora fragariae]